MYSTNERVFTKILITFSETHQVSLPFTSDRCDSAKSFNAATEIPSFGNLLTISRCRNLVNSNGCHVTHPAAPGRRRCNLLELDGARVGATAALYRVRVSLAGIMIA